MTVTAYLTNDDLYFISWKIDHSLTFFSLKFTIHYDCCIKYNIKNIKIRTQVLSHLNFYIPHRWRNVSVLASSAVDRGFEPRSGQTREHKFGICCFSANHATLRRKSKDWLARNQDNVSECGDMSISGRLFQRASTIKIQLSMLV